jgi:hypothetical protein
MFDDLLADMQEGDIFLDVTVSSTPSVLTARLTQNEKVRDARTLVRGNMDAADSLLRIAKTLYASESTPGYSHQHDDALAASIFILAIVQNPDVRRFIEKVAKSRDRGFRKALWLADLFCSQHPLLIQDIPAELHAFV